MLPWGHAAVGYLLYAAICRHTEEGKRIPDGAAVLALAVGTQFADLVDKPLAWYLGVLPTGRSLAHSLFVAIALVALLDRFAASADRRDLSATFALGYFAHLAGDAMYGLGGGLERLQFLLWPVIPQLPPETSHTILEMLIELTLSPLGLFESALFVATTVLWVSHRAPGLWLCVEAVRSIGPRG